MSWLSWLLPASGLGRVSPAPFFGRPNTYLFIGDYKYWLMTHRDAVNLDDGQDYPAKLARSIHRAD